MKKCFVPVLILLLSISAVFFGCKKSSASNVKSDKKQEAEKETGTKKDNKENGNEENRDTPPDEEKNDEDIYSLMSEDELLVASYDKDAEACYRIALMYDYGTEDKEQDFSTAGKWYEKAAEYGSAKAYTALGYMYLNGTGEPYVGSGSFRDRPERRSMAARRPWEACCSTGRYS